MTPSPEAAAAAAAAVPVPAGGSGATSSSLRRMEGRFCVEGAVVKPVGNTSSLAGPARHPSAPVPSHVQPSTGTPHRRPSLQSTSPPGGHQWVAMGPKATTQMQAGQNGLPTPPHLTPGLGAPPLQPTKTPPHPPSPTCMLLRSRMKSRRKEREASRVPPVAVTVAVPLGGPGQGGRGA